MSLPLLLEYFQELPQRTENETSAEWSQRVRGPLREYEKQVAARYSEGTLQRLLISDASEVRQATVLALGLCGTMQINRPLARMLHDEDERVRQLTEEALWAIWFRGASTEHSDALQRLMRRSAEGADAAQTLAGFGTLLEKAPKFAEAYNQRAVIHFRRGDFLRAIADCQKTLELNPHHYGAASGMAQCFMKQRKYHAALRSYRRALRLNPNLDGVRDAIASLEKMLDEEGRK